MIPVKSKKQGGEIVGSVARTGDRQFHESVLRVAHRRVRRRPLSGPDTIETERGLPLQAKKFIICVGGTNRRLGSIGVDRQR
jgi:hypothetical protein